MRLLVGLILNLWMGQLEQKIGELPFLLIGISRNLTNQLLYQYVKKKNKKNWEKNILLCLSATT